MARELRKAEDRAENAERRFDELVNRWLIRQGSFGIPHKAESRAQTTLPQPLRPKVETVNGVTEEEFIDDFVAAGLPEAEAKQKWKQALEVRLLPYQLEGELPS